MFTSEPSLPQRIERMIGNVSIVDTRSELASDQLGVSDLATLISESPVRIVLEGVGASAAVFDPARSVEDRVLEVLPFLRQVRTTAAGWCLFRIFRDLYDFDEPHLTAANFPELLDRVAKSAGDPNWPATVIERRARVGLVVAQAPTDDQDRVAAADFLRFRLEVVADAASDQSDESIRTQVFDQLDHEIEGKVRFVAVSGPPDLDNPIHAAVLAWHQLHECPLQVVLNLMYGPTQLELLDRAIREFPQVKFALLSHSVDQHHALASRAGKWPNVFTEGLNTFGACPSVIESNLLARIQHAGITKLGGFASGARSAEWVYGAIQATRKSTAAALAHSVASGFFEEDELPPLLDAMFSSSPIAWYRLAN